MSKRMVILMLISVLCLCGCGEVAGTSSRNPQGSDSVEEKVEAQDAGEDIEDETTDTPSAEDSAQSDAPEKESVPTGDYIDLSAEPSSMVYTFIFNMSMYRDNFMGKTIKIKGAYSDMYIEERDRHYFACLVTDATACCTQGLEFELKDEYKFPDDYPSDGEEIVVEGVFDVYDEDGETYPVLRNAVLCK